jgi:hypothetical protein
MAPRIEFSIEQIRNKARKDLLYLLEGVCYHSVPTAFAPRASLNQAQATSPMYVMNATHA